MSTDWQPGEGDTLADMALAHLRLTQSLRGIGMSTPAWTPTTNALVALADAITSRTVAAGRPGDGLGAA